MKKIYLIASLFLLGILMSSSLVSANWFTDLFDSDKNLVGEAYRYGSYVTEQVKCVFGDSTTTQVCSSNKGKCKGVESCVINVAGKKGEKIIWKSSCGGYAYITTDGQNDVAEFKCTQDVKENVKCVMWDATAPQECYSDKGSCKGEVQKDSTGRTYVSCGVDVTGKKGEQVTWKSSCGGYAYTTMDGQNDVAEFKCTTTSTQDVKETVKCVMWDATSPQECSSSKGSCKGDVKKDSTGRSYVSC